MFLRIQFSTRLKKEKLKSANFQNFKNVDGSVLEMSKRHDWAKSPKFLKKLFCHSHIYWQLLKHLNTWICEKRSYTAQSTNSKSQLFQLMLDILDDDQSANSVEKLQGKKFIIVVEGKAVQLSSDGFNLSKEDID